MFPFFILELENFKSFKEKTIIEWKQVSNIFGLNGSGKTTVVGAIEFLFCFSPYDKTSCDGLKGKICNRESTNYPRTVVTGKFHLKGEDVTFKRSAEYEKSICKYWINNDELKAKEYKDRLIEYDIDRRGNNIIIHQNTVESVASQKPSERREYFECLSSSINHKSTYDRLLKELQFQASEIKNLYENLKRYKNQQKYLRKESEKSAKYMKLREEIEEKEMEIQFAKLLKIERSMDATIKEQQELQLKIRTVVEKLKPPVEKRMNDLKNKVKELRDRLVELNEASVAISKKDVKNSLKSIKIEETITRYVKEIKKVEKNIESAKRVHDEQERIIADLKEQYESVSEGKEKYINSQSQNDSSRSVEQYNEYHRLKAYAQEKCAQEQCMIDSIEREIYSLKTKIDDYEKKKESIIALIKGKKVALEEARSKIKCSTDKIEEKQSERNLIEEKRNQLNDQINELNGESEKLERDIENLTEQINEKKLRKEESKKSRAKRAVLEDLKNNFTGVRGRLKQLCDVEEACYKTAITKLLESKMDYIIVDTTSTASDCIEHLRKKYRNEKFSVVESFQPLDYLPNRPNDNIRDFIRYLPYAKMATDIVSALPDIKELLKKVFLKSTVVCETDDQANKFSRAHKVNCVSWTGTLYRKDGIISGGLEDLLRRSEEWDENEYQSCVEQRDEKITRLRQLYIEVRKKEEEKQTLDNKLAGLSNLLQKYLVPQCTAHDEELEKINQEIKKLYSDLSDHKSKEDEINELRSQLNERNERLKELEKRKNEIEEEVFADFCRQYNISNIRKYELNDFRHYKEYEEKKNQFDDLLDKISNQLEYEQSRDTEKAVMNWEDHLRELKETYDKLLKKRQNLSKKTDENLEKTKEKKSIEQEIEKLRKEIKLEGFKLKSMNTDLYEWENSVASKNSRINNLRADMHNILRDCKIEGIDIPLQTGTMKKVAIDTILDLDTESSESSSRKESENSEIEEKDIEIDFSKLPTRMQKLGEEGLSEHISGLEMEIKSLQEELESVRPTSKGENIQSLMDKVKTLTREYNIKKREHAKTRKEYNEVKEERIKKLTEFFEAVNIHLVTLFKNLYNNKSAQAYLNFTNVEEPFSGGIDFSCMIPHKKFGPMERLSGGEKTMCALALFFAIYRVKPVPCLVFDEIDAALDKYNLKKLMRFMIDLEPLIQIIFISHHNILAECANAGIGISINPRTNSSEAIHIHLDEYRKTYDAEGRRSVEKFNALSRLHQGLEVDEMLSDRSEGSNAIDNNDDIDNEARTSEITGDDTRIEIEE